MGAVGNARRVQVTPHGVLIGPESASRLALRNGPSFDERADEGEIGLWCSALGLINPPHATVPVAPAQRRPI